MSKTLKASIILGGSMTSGLRGALGKTKDGLDVVGRALADVRQKQKALGQTIKDFSHLRVKNMDQLRHQYDELGRAADRLRLAQTRLAATQSAMDANNARRSALGGQLMGAIGGAVATGFAIGKPVSNAATFARENQLIGNTADMSRREVDALGETIKRVARETNQYANDIQKGIGFLVAAGLEIGTAEASIRTIGRTATAAGAEIEDMSKASFTLIDALGIKPDGLQGALDMLALAGKEGNVELKDMAKVLPVLGSSFTALKMGGSEAVATLGAALEVARKGAATADEAANNMQNFMAKMMAPETLKKAQKAFGLDLYKVVTDAQKSGANPFEAAMINIMRVTKGDQKLIGELFGDMQVQNFIRPMTQNWEEYQRIKAKALGEAAGTTDRDFAVMMEDQAEKMKAAKIAADNLAKSYGAAIAPAIGDAASKLTVFIDRVNAFVTEHPKFAAGATTVVAGFAAMKVAVLGGMYAWTAIKAPFLAVSNMVAKFRAAKAVGELGKLGATAVRIGGAFRWVATAVAAIGGGPIALAVAALTAGALVVRKYWEPVKAYFTGVWQGIRDGVAPVLGELVAAVAPLAPAWDAVTTAIGGAWNWFTNLLEPVTMTSDEIEGATSAGRTFGRVVAGALTHVIRGTAGVIRAVVIIGSTVADVCSGIASGFVTAWDAAKRTVGSAVDWITRKMRPVTDGVRWIVDKAQGVGSAVGSLWGVGGSQSTPSAPTSAPLPVMATARGGSGGGTTVQQSNTFHITQLPGESSEELARRIAAEQRRQEEARRRGRLGDD